MLEISDYLEDIEATRSVRERVDVFRARYARLLPGIDFNRAFITEIIDSDGLRVWQNLWLISPDYLAEATNFLSTDEFDGAALKAVRHWSIKMTDFELGEPSTDKSRVRLEFDFASSQGIGLGLSGTLTASGTNCPHLVHVFEDVVRSRIESFRQA